MTTPRFKTAESPFKSDNTASNQCGFTLMNNQVGVVVAQVMSGKVDVTASSCKPTNCCPGQSCSSRQHH